MAKSHCTKCGKEADGKNLVHVVRTGLDKEGYLEDRHEWLCPECVKEEEEAREEEKED